MPKIASYGKWISPITPEMTTRSGKSNRSSDIQISNGNIYWTEPRPAEKGRTALVCRYPDGSTVDIVPPGYDVRSKVHKYGGLSYTVHEDVVYFVNCKDQVLYALTKESEPKPLTSGDIRIADLHICSQGLVAIGEKHIDNQVNNFLVLVNLENSKCTKLDTGHDFYASPTVSPDGKRLAWITWDHPNMPWDGTQLWVADIANNKLINKKCVAGGPNESIFQPQWSPK